jgi:cobalt-zinc-cadmium efflux system protein
MDSAPHHHSPQDDHAHAHAHEAAGAHAHAHADGAGNRRRLLLAALLTGGFMLAEAAGGVLTGSLALLADSGHMLTDAVALALGYAGYRFAVRPFTRRMTYGFVRLLFLVAYT